MHHRYLVMVLVTSLALVPVAATPPPPHCGVSLRDRYSPRALRRMRAELQLRLLQAKRRRIALAGAVLAHHGSPDVLLGLPDDAAILAQGTGDPRLKHLAIEDATTCW
jgi:hypothetical protein